MTVYRNPVCPINLNPESLIIRTGGRGTTEAGRLIIGLSLGAGLVESSSGLSVDSTFVQDVQFRKKWKKVFSEAKTIKDGIS